MFDFSIEPTAITRLFRQLSSRISALHRELQQPAIQRCLGIQTGGEANCEPGRRPFSPAEAASDDWGPPAVEEDDAENSNRMLNTYGRAGAAHHSLHRREQQQQQQQQQQREQREHRQPFLPSPSGALLSAMRLHRRAGAELGSLKRQETQLKVVFITLLRKAVPESLDTFSNGCMVHVTDSPQPPLESLLRMASYKYGQRLARSEMEAEEVARVYEQILPECSKRHVLLSHAVHLILSRVEMYPVCVSLLQICEEHGLPFQQREIVQHIIAKFYSSLTPAELQDLWELSPPHVDIPALLCAALSVRRCLRYGHLRKMVGWCANAHDQHRICLRAIAILDAAKSSRRTDGLRERALREITAELLGMYTWGSSGAARDADEEYRRFAGLSRHPALQLHHAALAYSLRGADSDVAAAAVPRSKAAIDAILDAYPSIESLVSLGTTLSAMGMHWHAVQLCRCISVEFGANLAPRERGAQVQASFKGLFATVYEGARADAAFRAEDVEFWDLSVGGERGRRSQKRASANHKHVSSNSEEEADIIDRTHSDEEPALRTPVPRRQGRAVAAETTPFSEDDFVAFLRSSAHATPVPRRAPARAVPLPWLRRLEGDRNFVDPSSELPTRLDSDVSGLSYDSDENSVSSSISSNSNSVVDTPVAVVIPSRFPAACGKRPLLGAAVEICPPPVKLKRPFLH